MRLLFDKHITLLKYLTYNCLVKCDKMKRMPNTITPITLFGYCCQIIRKANQINMSSSAESYASFAIVMASAAVLLDEERPDNRKRTRNRNAWVSEWVKKRATEGLYAKLLPELRTESPKLYRNFVRMSAEDFEYLRGLVAPFITKTDTQMRKSISAGERLALTLRFLATGDSFVSLQYLFRIPETTISRIVPEVLDAIYTVLKDNFMKVSSNLPMIWLWPFCKQLRISGERGTASFQADNQYFLIKFIFPGISSGVPPGKCSVISPGLSSGIPPGTFSEIPSGISTGIPPGISSGIFQVYFRGMLREYFQRSLREYNP